MELFKHVEPYKDNALYVSGPDRSQILVLKPDESDTVRFLHTVRSTDIEAVWIAFGAAKIDRLNAMFTKFVSATQHPNNLGILVEKLVDVVGMAEFEEIGEYDIFRLNDIDDVIKDFINDTITYRFLE